MHPLVICLLVPVIGGLPELVEVLIYFCCPLPVAWAMFQLVEKRTLRPRATVVTAAVLGGA